MNENTRLKVADSRISEFLAAPDVHDWAKEVMRKALTKDPVDAEKDLEIIYLLLAERCAAMLKALSPRSLSSSDPSVDTSLRDLLKLMEKEQVGVMTLATYKPDGKPYFLVAMTRDSDVADEIRQVVEDYHA